MLRFLNALAMAAIPLMLAAGCSQKADNLARPDAAYQQLNKQLGQQGLKRLDFQEAPVMEVAAWLEKELGCKVQVLPAASAYIAQADPRVTARMGETPADQAYEAVRFQLETKGLTLEPVGNVTGKPRLTVDRSTLREATAPAPR